MALLSDALRLTDADRAALIAAAVQGPVQKPPDDGTSERVPGTQPAHPSTPPTPPAPSFVGRDDELRLLHDSWEQRTRVALLFGEAGVGKSALADRFADQLRSRGVTILRGRSTPQQLGVFEAFVEPVHTALGRFDGAIPASLRDIGRLVPGLLDARSAALVPIRSDPAGERRLLFEAVVALLASLGPTVLLLDDLHWADDGTLAMLAFVAARPELSDVMIVGGVRSTDVTPATSAALAELRRHCTVVRTTIDGFGRVDLERLVAVVAGSEMSADFLDAVTVATNGNPLYIKELTEHLLQAGFDPHRDATTVPDGIRDTIELRVGGLSRDAQALVRGAAVLGPTFDLHLAGQLVGLGGEELLGAAEDALLSGLLIEDTAVIASFSHGLVATTVYEGMPRSRRLLLHRAAATALTERGPVSSGAIVDVERHWVLVAADDPQARDTAARWSVRAGDAAAASASIDEAIACYERAASAWTAPTSEHADTLVRLGSALMSAGSVSSGKERLQQALRIADEAGDPAVFARAALGLSASVRYTASDPERIDELEQAIAKLDSTEMVLRPALFATLRRQLGFVDTPEAERRRREAAAAVEEAVSAPDVSDDLLISLGSLRDSLVVDDPVPLGEFARKIIAVASARQDLSVLSTGWYRQAWAALELGDPVTLRRAVHEYRRIAERLRRPYELAMSSNMIAAIAQIEGRYDDAEAAGQEALAHAATIDDGNFSWVYFSNSGLRAWDTGDIAATFEMMQAVRPDFAGLHTFEASFVAAAAGAGHHDFAGQLLDEQIGPNGEILDRDWWYLSAERLPALGLWSWGCSMSGNVRHAAVLRTRLEQVAELGVRAVRVAPVGSWVGPLDHHLGALNRVLGDLDRAEMHLMRALDLEAEMNGRPYRVRTMMELAAVEGARSGSAGSSPKAAQWLALAEDLAVELGLEGILATPV